MAFAAACASNVDNITSGRPAASVAVALHKPNTPHSGTVNNVFAPSVSMPKPRAMSTA